MKVVIMAGGKGTRIASVNSLVPKPMIDICGKPILEHQIEFFKKHNLKDIILVVGYMKEHIINYFKDGKNFGVNIQYIEETTPLGTAGSFYYLKEYIFPNEDFLLVNGDIIFDIDIDRLINFHTLHKAKITLVAHPNSHPFDSALIIKNKDNLVEKWLTKEEDRTFYENLVNSGIHVVNYDVLLMVDKPEKIDFDREIIRKLILDKCVYAYSTTEYIKDMGTPERYYQVISDVKENKLERRNLSHKQKAFFIDRDGTINKYVGFLRNINDFELKEGTAEGIKKINNSDYLAIVVTNQPVIARGEVTVDELKEIHNKMETLLGEKGAYIDAIYYCPHHPDSGFEGEIKELKIKCNCRKPAPGLVEMAVKDYNIDLAYSYVIGDTKADEDLAKNLGIKYLEVNETNNINDVVMEVLS